MDRDLLAEPLKQAPYQQLGTLLIDHPGLDETAASGYERSLDLDPAVAGTSFTVAGTHYRRRVIASPVDQVIAVEITASGSERLNLDLSFTSPQLQWAAHTQGNDTLILTGRNGADDRIAGALSFEARLRDGERAHSILRFLLGPARTYPNMFDAHPPFQIDGNFGGAAGIAEMLVQEDNDALHLLPALPSAWPEGALTGVRLYCSAKLDLAWSGGTLASARITGGMGDQREVRLGERRASARLVPDGSVTLTAADFV